MALCKKKFGSSSVVPGQHVCSLFSNKRDLWQRCDVVGAHRENTVRGHDGAPRTHYRPRHSQIPTIGVCVSKREGYRLEGLGLRSVSVSVSFFSFLRYSCYFPLFPFFTILVKKMCLAAESDQFLDPRSEVEGEMGSLEFSLIFFRGLFLRRGMNDWSDGKAFRSPAMETPISAASLLILEGGGGNPIFKAQENWRTG